jgi:putative methyltransferase (TIGR04325 family)
MSQAVQGLSSQPPSQSGLGLRAFTRTARSLLGSPATKAMVRRMERWVPLVRYFHERLYEREFATIVPFARRFRGVYRTFEEAIQAAPAGKPIGYDNAEAATFMAPADPIRPNDYPVMFWLQKTMAETPSILDIGGYVGISYYSYAKHLTYPEHLRWMIYDVPAVTKQGIEIARNTASPGLSFTTEINGQTQAHIVLALGSLQFIEKSCSELLSQMATRPMHLIINKTPLTDLADFVTLQDLGPAVCPYWVFNRAKFIHSIQDLGYELVDSWANLELGCHIPLHEDHSVPNYSGLYFRANS